MQPNVLPLRPTVEPPRETPPPVEERKPSKILVLDIGGTKIKMLATGHIKPRKASSGKKLTPGKMIEIVRALTNDWEYEAVSLGYPGLVGLHGPRSEPGNLGPGWVGFDFAAAFGCPVRVINMRPCKPWAAMKAAACCFWGWARASARR
jgi:predicted NBD/HSP70 family sugar kinase